MNATGYVKEIHPHEGVTLFVPFEDTYILEKRKITQAEVRLDDGRTISADQRRKIYATLRDISMYTGHTTEFL